MEHIVTEVNFLHRSEQVHKYSNQLPHWERPYKVQYVTFRLADSLPAEKLQEYVEIKQEFHDTHTLPWNEEALEQYHEEVELRVDRWLGGGAGCCLLQNEEARNIVKQELMKLDGKAYDLLEYVLMPNHIHLLFVPYESMPLKDIMSRIKGASAYQINRLTGHTGRLWQAESFDHMVRNKAEYERYSDYIHENPRHLQAGTYSLMTK